MNRIVAAYTSLFSNYANTTGRMSRLNYWCAELAHIVVWILLGMVDGALFPTALIPGIYLLLMLFPILAATVRRLHDTGKGAAYLLLCFVPALGVIILFVFLCQAGTNGMNRFGLPDSL